MLVAQALQAILGSQSDHTNLESWLDEVASVEAPIRFVLSLRLA